jgi:hypothetical protein
VTFVEGRGKMRKTLLVATTRANWESIVLLLIKNNCGSGDFSLRLLRSLEDKAEKISLLLGHKPNPQHIDATIRKTVFNLRDKGYLESLGQGNYRVTQKGRERTEEIVAATAEEIHIKRDEEGWGDPYG